MPSGALTGFGLDRSGRRWAVFSAVVLLVLVVMVGIRVAHTVGPLHVDRLGTRVVDSSHLDSRRLFRRFVWLGSAHFVVGAAAVLAVWRLARRDLAGAALAVLGPALAVVLTEDVAKPVIGRRIHPGAAFTFPSGHVTGAAAIAAVAVALAIHAWGRRGSWTALPASLVPVAVSAGVVRAGYHYPTDAAGGLAVGIAAVLLVVAALSAVEPRLRRRAARAGPVAQPVP